MNFWTSEDVTRILIQLDNMQLPFSKYAFCQQDGRLRLLGSGGSADVYEAMSRASGNPDYAIKVIGFRRQYTDSECFNESVQVQKDISDYQNNVVKIYGHTELWVRLDEDDNVVEAVSKKPEQMTRTTIKLQFILMERIATVITRTKSGNIRISPEALARGEESEILKLAYDIGIALKKAHNAHILHRDVKLENVFYSEKQGQYKLGDFGIAKRTYDGYADTVAFTKGYAAPEVRTSDDRYDNTADIYSYGMMLYVLANGLKFPDSNTYNVNSSIQYEPGYVLPVPDGPISEDLYYVIAKACMYDADQRYQSMEELLSDIEQLMYSASLAYKKEHKNASLAVSFIMMVVGVVVWRLDAGPGLSAGPSLWEYMLLLCCIGKGLLKIRKKNVAFLSICVLGLGIYLLITRGFSWPMLIILLWVTLSSGTSAAYLATGALTADIMSLIQQTGLMTIQMTNNYSWVTVTLVSLSMVLLFQYEVLTIDDRKIIRAYYDKGLYWILICLIYGVILVMGLTWNSAMDMMARSMIGDRLMTYIVPDDMCMVGMYGLCFALFWIIREHMMIVINKGQSILAKFIDKSIS